MIISTGVDIVKIERLRNIVKKRGEKFLSRVFTQEEIGYCNSKVNKFQHFAGRFASKEAISKALRIKWDRGLNWREIEIISNHNSIPEVRLSGQAKEVAEDLKIDSINLSISHCQDYAVAMAVITGDQRSIENSS